MIFCSLKTQAQSLARELIPIFDTSMMIPPLAPPDCHFNAPTFEPRSVTVVLGEVTGAPSVISVVLFGQTRRDA